MDPQNQQPQGQHKVEQINPYPNLKIIDQNKIIHPNQFKWNLENFNPRQSLMDIEHLNSQKYKTEFQFQSDINIYVKQSGIQGSGLNKHVTYIVVVKDKQGQYQIVRRYRDFDLLHQKLVMRWPACYIPSIPNKTLMGNSDKQVTQNRIRFLNNFLRKIASVPSIYYNQQFQDFLKAPDSNSVQKALQKYQQLPFSQILARYQKSFPELTQEAQVSQDQLKAIIDWQYTLMDWKLQLNNYKIQMRKLAQLKQKYQKSQKLIFSKLLPNLQQIFSDWYKNQQKQNNINQNPIFFSTQSFKKKFQEIQFDLWSHNPYWLYYDILKFQIRQIDALLTVIQQCKKLKSQKLYYQRTILINKQQIQALNQKKTTLKIFFLGGSQDQKRTKLTKQSQECQNKLQQLNHLFIIVIGLSRNSFKQFHLQRINFYHKCMGKSAKQQIQTIKKFMQFYYGHKQVQQNEQN